jgi:geranylgeranyl diphosphate synthase, type II
MLVRAYDLMLGIAPEHLRHLLARFNRTASEVCEGQQLDMNFEAYQTVTEAQYLEMIRLKTAVLLGFALETGALLGGSSDVQANLLRCFGTDLGIGFQLKDDLLDVYGEQAKVGKQVGGDILSNKKTFLLLTAIARAQGDTAERLQKWLAFQPLSDEQKIQKVRGVMDIYAELGVRETAETKMYEYFDRAFEHLAAVQARADRKQFLEQFAREIVGRDR